MAISSFSDSITREFFEHGHTKRNVGWKNIQSIVRRKLDTLHYATTILDLRSPPANRLEALKGDLAGYYSIRVNDQWRIVFRWTATGPASVRVCDYH